MPKFEKISLENLEKLSESLKNNKNPEIVLKMIRHMEASILENPSLCAYSIYVETCGKTGNADRIPAMMVAMKMVLNNKKAEDFMVEVVRKKGCIIDEIGMMLNTWKKCEPYFVSRILSNEECECSHHYEIDKTYDLIAKFVKKDGTSLENAKNYELLKAIERELYGSVNCPKSAKSL